MRNSIPRPFFFSFFSFFNPRKNRDERIRVIDVVLIGGYGYKRESVTNIIVIR